MMPLLAEPFDPLYGATASAARCANKRIGVEALSP
jgi:hypothetical protein